MGTRSGSAAVFTPNYDGPVDEHGNDPMRFDSIGTPAQSLRNGRGEGGRRWWCRPKRAGLSLLAMALLWVGSFAEQASAQRPSQDEVEAAYLYNFGKFVRWPETGEHGAMRICVTGPASFEQTVSKLTTDEQIDGRTLAVTMVERPEQVADCSILYVGGMERSRTDAWLEASAGKPVLTVSDGADFLDRGGMIQFVRVQDHIRFSVNLGAANRSGVGLSSELLKVAVQVTGKTENGGPR